MTTRRNLITASAALAAGSVVNLAAVIARADADPIFGVIERHRSAYMRHESAFEEERALERCVPSSRRRSYRIMDDYYIYDEDDPRWLAVVDREGEACEDMEAACDEMASVRPTTMAGVVALLDYIDQFNQGKFRYSKTGYSEPIFWPEELIDDAVTDGGGKPLKMPWAFWVMRNVQAALQSIRGTA